jgi:hypothetical protein
MCKRPSCERHQRVLNDRGARSWVQDQSGNRPTKINMTLCEPGNMQSVTSVKQNSFSSEKNEC